MSSKSVVLVDDSESDRVIITRLLKKAGFEVLECSNLSELDPLLETHHPDLLLLDYHLPDGTALDFMSGQEEKLAFPVIILTSSDVGPNRIKLFEAGITEYHTKDYLEVPFLKMVCENAMHKWKLLDKIHQQNSELTSFASRISHDLKEHLALIKTATDVISEAEDESDRKVFKVIKNQAEMCLRLIDGLRSLSAIDGVETQWAAFDLLEFIEHKLAPNHLEIDFKLSGDSCCILADANLMELVFDNLVRNSVRYHDKEKPTLFIEFGVNENKIEISVEDDGPGIEKQVRDIVFMPLIRHNLKGDGMGLGLSIAQRAIEKMGGEISCVEPQHGRGARFLIQLPQQET